MNTKSISNNTNIVIECTQRIQALGRFVTPAEVILLNGQERQVSEVVLIYQKNLDARAAVAAANQARKVALAARAQTDVERRANDKALRAWVVSRFGEGSPQALAFGFAPHARPVTNVDAKARAKALSNATRKARHTMGTRQRAEIKGVLPSGNVSTASTDAANTNGAPGTVATVPTAVTPVPPGSTTAR